MKVDQWSRSPNTASKPDFKRVDLCESKKKKIVQANKRKEREIPDLMPHVHKCNPTIDERKGRLNASNLKKEDLYLKAYLTET